MPSKRAKFRKKYKRNQGKLPGLPKGGRPPGVPWSAGTKKNPSGGIEELAEMTLAAGAGFGGTKLVSRIAYGVMEKRGSRWAKHVGVLASVAATGLVWGVAHRLHKKAAEYHTPLVVGSAIASLQNMVQTYVPKYGWLVGHPTETAALPQPQGDDGVDYAQLLSEPRGTTMNYDPSMEAQPRANGNRRRPRAQPQSQAASTHASVNGPAEGDAELDQLLNEIQDENAEMAQGVFSN